MRKIFGAATVALLICSLTASLSVAQTVDGMLDAAYGGASAIQTVDTDFGDNQSEWNAGYVVISPTELFLMFTGNLQNNFNKLEIFIDSTNSSTTNVYNNPLNTDGTGVMNGMTFDSGFTPDYHIIARHGNDNGNDKFDLDFIDLAGQVAFSDVDIFGALSTGIGVGANTGIAIGFDNSNTAGIGGGTGAADQTAALAVTTGLELGISLADIGNPTGAIRIMLLQNNDNHDFLSNQTLGGLPAGTGNLGSPANAVDFNNFAGNQFFTTIPEPATAGFLGMLAMTGLMIRRRK